MLLIRLYNFAGNYRNSHSPGRGNDDDNQKDHLSESSDFDTPGGVVKKELKRSSKMWEYRSRRRTHRAALCKLNPDFQKRVMSGGQKSGYLEFRCKRTLAECSEVELEVEVAS